MVISRCFWLVVVMGMLMGCGGEPSEAQQVYETCREAVEDKLVAPTSAVFPAVGDVEIVRMGSGTLHVRGEVDSQNQMGVLVRLDFECTMDGDRSNVTAKVTGRGVSTE